MRTVGERLPEFLRAYGVEVVFGIPGVHTVELYRGLPAQSLRHITPRHEQGAGFMADGYARVTGKPGVCFIITGPGMTNIATAMGQAYADSIPMLVISSVNRVAELGRGEGRLHELKDQRAMMEGVAAYSQTLRSPEDIVPALDRAFASFQSARPRPVHLEIPIDVIDADAEHLSMPVIRRSGFRTPDVALIARAATVLMQANNPFVVLGGGASAHPMQAQALVERIGAPTVLTINAKGLLPKGHPLNLGSTMPLSPVLDALQNADVVLAVGTELGETDTLLFGQDLDLHGTLIRVDIDADQFSRNGSAQIGIQADANEAMRALSKALDDLGHEAGSRGKAVTETLRVQAHGLIAPAYRTHGKILDRILLAFPDLIVIGDSTQPVYGANLTFNCGRHRSYFNSSTGYGTLGYGLPAAIGAKLGQPGRSVVSLIGDGGLQFTIAELATAVELSLSLPILLWNNHGYSEIKQYMINRDIAQIGVDIYTPDFLAIAKGFGCDAVRAESPAHLITLLSQAFEADKPTVIELLENDVLSWRW